MRRTLSNRGRVDYCSRGSGGDGGGHEDFHLLGGDESGRFDEAAELFFSDVLVDAMTEQDILEGFVVHGQSFESDDEDIVVAQFPELILL